MQPRAARRALPWVITVLCLAAVLVMAGLLLLPKFGLLGTNSDNRNTQIIQSVSREEQVALVSLGIQGLSEDSSESTIPWNGDIVPWSERATFVQYAFTAKLGLDGKDVQIDQKGEDSFLVSIPKFIFIGHDDVDFRLVTENNGALSWLTPEIDQLDMANTVLDEDAQQEYIDSHDELLREQAEAFYGGIITSVDPTVHVEFEFSD